MYSLRPTTHFPARKYASVYLPNQPMKEEAEISNDCQQDETDELQNAYKKVVSKCEDERDDEHIHEDESCYCHGDFYLRVNDYVCKLLLL